MTTQYDIIIIGAGPAGLSFARTLANSPVSITIIEKSPLESIERPAYDGREIALTHLSKEIMERLGMWQRVPENVPDEYIPLAKSLDSGSKHIIPPGLLKHIAPGHAHQHGDPADGESSCRHEHGLNAASACNGKQMQTHSEY